jgi:hypothetical protein
MKSFSVLVLLLAALTAVTAIPNAHAFGLFACGRECQDTFERVTLTISDDDGCLADLYGRAIMGSSSAVTAASSTEQIVTETVDTSTIVCPEETASTTTVSQSTTNTSFIIVTITSR